MCCAWMFSGAPDKASMPCSQKISKYVIVHTQLPSPWEPSRKGMGEMEN